LMGHRRRPRTCQRSPEEMALRMEEALISNQKVEAENEGLKRSVEASQKESAESKEAGAKATQRALPKRERMLS